MRIFNGLCWLLYKINVWKNRVCISSIWRNRSTLSGKYIYFNQVPLKLFQLFCAKARTQTFLFAEFSFSYSLPSTLKRVHQHFILHPLVRVRRLCCYPTPRQLVCYWSEEVLSTASIGQERYVGGERWSGCPVPLAPCCLRTLRGGRVMCTRKWQKTSGRLIGEGIKQQRKQINK